MSVVTEAFALIVFILCVDEDLLPPSSDDANEDYQWEV
jgi:hypothetical protein